MTVRRILFIGNAIACAKYLPWAKGKLKTLSRTNASRHSWTHEYKVGSDTISLEQNGQVQWIRINAGLVGYEFVTVLDPLYPPVSDTDWNGHTAFWTIAKLAKIDDPDQEIIDPEAPADRIPALIPVNRKGTKLKPENRVRQIDLKDKWLRTGRYDPYFGTPEEDPDGLTYFLFPTHDWFQVAVPENDAQALEAAGGAPRAWMMFWTTWRARHYDLALWTDRQGIAIQVGGEAFTITPGGNSRKSGLSLAISDPPALFPDNFPRCGGMAKQGGVLLAASWNAHDFLFEARNENYTEYITGSTFFFITKPSWIGAGEIDVDSHWYWRGDGQRAVSLQYASTRRPADSGEWTLANYDPDIDAGFVEIEVITTDPVGEIAPDLPNIAILSNQHNLWQQGIMPVAIDYRILDGRKKLAYYLISYIGPQRIHDSSVEDTYYTIEYARDLLIYLVCTEIEDSVLDGQFPGTEQWRLPVWHGGGWRGVNADDPEPPADPLLHMNPIDGNYWSGDVGYPILSKHMTTDGVPVHPYRDLRAVVVAMDARAEAVAISYQVDMHEPHTIDPGGINRAEVSAPWNGKVWRIWGEERQNTWTHPDTATGTDEPGPGYIPTYSTWIDDDPSIWEEAEPPEPDPTLPPGDFFNYLDPLPAGYALFQEGHTYDFKGVRSGIYNIMSTIMQQMVFIGLGAGEFSPYRSYSGFRIAPTKSFSLTVNTLPNYRWVNHVYTGSSPDNGLQDLWWTYDHIEKNLGPDQEPLLYKHRDLYNESRGTDFGFLCRMGNLNVNAVNGLWVE